MDSRLRGNDYKQLTGIVDLLETLIAGAGLINVP